ncbi:MAG TPA: VOC family protein [Kineosporiaceae bacterium]
MIIGVHALLYAHDPDAARAFLRDVLGFPASDAGGGWLIFRTGPSELGVHPSGGEHGGQSGSTEQAFDVSLMCDDLDATMAELRAKGARFAGAVQQQSWGAAVQLGIPGTRHLVTLFQPRYHPPALAL